MAKAAQERLNAMFSPKKSNLLIRKLGGSQRLEDHLIGVASLENNPIAASMCDSFLNHHFRIESYQTEDLIEQSKEQLAEYRDFCIGEKQIFSPNLDIDGKAERLIEFGVDIYDQEGRPLRATPFIAMPIEACALGLIGQLPISEEYDKEESEASLIAEVEDWKKKRR